MSGVTWLAGSLLVDNSNESVQFALSARDGSLLWSRTYLTQLIAMAAVGELIYAAACSGDGGGSFAGTSPTLISATATGNGTRVWTQSMPQTAQTFTVTGAAVLLSASPAPAAGGIAYPGGAASQTDRTARTGPWERPDQPPHLCGPQPFLAKMSPVQVK